jgi:lipopolysaccharide/colanic/teichoic acid biosynthesis glycosyltransferase
VITRDMALVGPRPEMAEMLCHYRGADLAKFSVAPGITGYAQIYGRGDLTFLETLDYDLRYVKERSLKVDVLVLLHTVRCVFFCKGAM